LLLVGENATVTVCHSRTKNLPDVVRQADIIIAAIGRAEMVRGDWVKPGAAIIDVGINGIPLFNEDGSPLMSEKPASSVRNWSAMCASTRPRKSLASLLPSPAASAR
jgi:5,10-methylene-tetrahydrofolate dehydrogenase/methenyl tetrahydrofolate cyclohydrolase